MNVITTGYKHIFSVCVMCLSNLCTILATRATKVMARDIMWIKLSSE